MRTVHFLRLSESLYLRIHQLRMNRANLLLICALSVASGFPSGRFERTRKDYVPLFPVKKVFEIIQLYMDDANSPGPLFNNDHLSKGDLTISEDSTTELPARLSLLDYMKNSLPNDIMPEDFEGIKKKSHRAQKPWRNGDYIDNYLRNFRSISGTFPVDIEDDFLS